MHNRPKPSVLEHADECYWGEVQLSTSSPNDHSPSSVDSVGSPSSVDSIGSGTSLGSVGSGDLETSGNAEQLKCEVLVIGAGSAGLSCSLLLSQAGFDVHVVDVKAPGSGAAGRNGGLLLAGTSDFYHEAIAKFGQQKASRLYQLSLQELDKLCQMLPSVNRCGSIRQAYDALEQRDLDAHQLALVNDDIPCNRLDSSTLEIIGDATFDPVERISVLYRDCLNAGVGFHFGLGAITIETSSTQTQPGHQKHANKVYFSNGSFAQATTVVCCIDGGLEHLLPELGGRARTTKLQMCATAPDSNVNIPLPIYRRFGFDYCQQRPDGAVLAGGFRDKHLDSQWMDSAGLVDVDPQVQGELDSWLSELGVTQHVSHRWSGAVAYTNSGLPICEQTRPNLWACGAYNGTGNIWSSICGNEIAIAIAESRDHIALFD